MINLDTMTDDELRKELGGKPGFMNPPKIDQIGRATMIKLLRIYDEKTGDEPKYSKPTDKESHSAR